MQAPVPDVPMNVEVNPNEDTEWNDILRKHKIIPEKPKSPEPIITEAIIEAQRKQHENRLEDKDIDELDALEDEEEEAFLAQYRQKRMAELQQLQKTSIHGQVYGIQKSDYNREVTEASSQYFVLLNLSSNWGNNIQSRVLDDLWKQLATKFGDIKFCQIRADMCIEGYPEKNTPTILVYKDGAVKAQLATLKELRGDKTDLGDLEQYLVSLGAVEENDIRLKKKESTPTPDQGNGTDDDDDWD